MGSAAYVLKFVNILAVAAVAEQQPQDVPKGVRRSRRCHSMYAVCALLVRWLYRWAADEPGHVHTVDVFRVGGGKVAEELAYVKG
jgi:hypothetical protein